MPSIPNITPGISITKEDAINLILSSIGLEELGLSHIYNAEGEKLQYILGTLFPGQEVLNPTVDDVIAVNEAIRNMLLESSKTQEILGQKMQIALKASDYVNPNASRGPQGPTGVTGPDNLTVGPTGPDGQQGNEGNLGPEGATGATGGPGVAGLQGIQGLTGTTGPDGEPGYFTQYVNPIAYWDSINPVLLSLGMIVVYDEMAYLVVDTPIDSTDIPDISPKFELLFPAAAIGPTGPQGLQGLQGSQGPQGLAGLLGLTGPIGPIGIRGPQGPVGSTGPAGEGSVDLSTVLQFQLPWATDPNNGVNQGSIVQEGNTLYMVMVDNPQGIPSSFGGFSVFVAASTYPDYVPIFVLGDEGAKGFAGTRGVTGSTGATGPSHPLSAATGATGVTGTAGITGITGTTGFNGAQGLFGATGTTGLSGANGIDISRSISFTEALALNPIPNGTMIRTPDDSAVYMATQDFPPSSIILPLSDVPYLAPLYTIGSHGANGATGATGATGIGLKGAKGPTGLAGQPGVNGVTGMTGATGIGLNGYSAYDPLETYNTGNIVEENNQVYMILINNFTGSPSDPSNSAFVQLLADKGPQGSKGPTGPQGLIGGTGNTGATGATGSQGAVGNTGETGPRGATGETGLTGATGEVGDEGPAGPIGPTGAPVPSEAPLGPAGPAGAAGPEGNPGPIGHTGYANPAPYIAYCGLGAVSTAAVNNRDVRCRTINFNLSYNTLFSSVNWGSEHITPISSGTIGSFDWYSGFNILTPGVYKFVLNNNSPHANGQYMLKINGVDMFPRRTTSHNLFNQFIYVKTTPTPEVVVMNSLKETVANAGNGTFEAYKIRD